MVIHLTHLLSALDTQAHVARLVTDSHECLETGDLTGSGYLLHRHDLHHLILQLRPEEEVHDLVLWDTQCARGSMAYVNQFDGTTYAPRTEKKTVVIFDSQGRRQHYKQVKEKYVYWEKGITEAP